MNQPTSIERLLDMAHLVENAGMSERCEVLRFGDVAVDLGYTTRQAVDRALAAQQRRATMGLPHRLLGELLEAQGALSREQRMDVVTRLTERARAHRRRRADPTHPLVSTL
jgi:hypothetical protein